MNRNDIIRILVVSGGNDDSMMEGLYHTVDNAKDIIIVGEVSSGEEALEAARHLSPDVIVMLIITKNIARNLAPAVKARAAGLFSPVAGAEELLSTIYRIHQWSPYSLSLQ